MVKKKSTASKISKAATTRAGSTRGRKRRITKTSLAAATTQAAAVTNSRRHTYTRHTSKSRQHYASIMKAVILFLGFVLLLAILANIFAPSFERRTMMHQQGNLTDTAPARKMHYATPDRSAGYYTPSRLETPSITGQQKQSIP